MSTEQVMQNSNLYALFEIFKMQLGLYKGSYELFYSSQKWVSITVLLTNYVIKKVLYPAMTLQGNNNLIVYFNQCMQMTLSIMAEMD